MKAEEVQHIVEAVNKNSLHLSPLFLTTNNSFIPNQYYITTVLARSYYGRRDVDVVPNQNNKVPNFAGGGIAVIKTLKLIVVGMYQLISSLLTFLRFLALTFL